MAENLPRRFWNRRWREARLGPSIIAPFTTHLANYQVPQRQHPANGTLAPKKWMSAATTNKTFQPGYLPQVAHKTTVEPPGKARITALVVIESKAMRPVPAANRLDENPSPNTLPRYQVARSNRMFPDCSGGNGFGWNDPRIAEYPEDQNLARQRMNQCGNNADYGGSKKTGLGFNS